MVVKDENIRIHITIPKKVHDKLEAESEYQDRSISRQLTRILKERYKIKDDDDE